MPDTRALQAATRERLRRLIREIESRPPAPRSLLEVSPPASAPLPGAVRRETPSGPCTYLERRFPLDEHVVGLQPLTALRHAEGPVLALLTADEDAASASLDELLFLDIETTGLGGAGAIVFLVATAHVQDGALRMRQYLAESPAEEPALLDALLADLRAVARDPVLVTYNGRTFDAPLLDGRAVLHRRRAGFESLRHVDVLVPARAVYRGWLPSCRLADIEARVLGVTRPSADVDGAEVPAWYFRFLRSGDMRFVAPIASHNRLDVLSLAALTGRLAGLAKDADVPRGPEALGLGRLLARRDPQLASVALRRAADDLDDGYLRREALWRLALLHKRSGAPERALPLWEELAASPGAWSLAACEELAKFYEHRERDYPRAVAAVERGLAFAGRGRLPGAWPSPPPHAAPSRAERWQGAFHYRLARLTSRMGRTRARPAEGEAPGIGVPSTRHDPDC